MNYYNGGMHGHRFGDRQFVNSQILRLPVDIQGKIRVEYSNKYQSLEGQDDQRYRCNTWLRAVVKKYGFIK